MKLPVIQGLWVGESLSNLEKLSIQSFLDHGHEYHLYTYGEVDGVPAGATLKDGNQILPESSIYRLENNTGTLASFSDWFRYKLLAEKGGFWADTDMVCVKPLDFAEEIVLASEDHGTTTNIIGIPKNHPLMHALLKHADSIPDKANSGWCEVGGPPVIKRYVEELNLEHYVRPQISFNPLIWDKWYVHFFHETNYGGWEIHPDTYCVHFFNEMLRRHRINKNAKFHGQSPFERLKAKHGIVTAVAEPESGIAESIQAQLAVETKVRAESEAKIARMYQKRKRVAWQAAGLFLALGIVLGQML